MTSFKKTEDVTGKSSSLPTKPNQTVSILWSLSLPGCPYEFKCLFLSMPRVQLFQRIDARCEAIIEQGLFPVSW